MVGGMSSERLKTLFAVPVRPSVAARPRQRNWRVIPANRETWQIEFIARRIMSTSLIPAVAVSPT